MLDPPLKETGLRKPFVQGKTFDTIICRQAFNFLDIHGSHGEKLANLIAMVAKPGARFVFDCFIKPYFGAKTYEFEGHRYLEARGYFGRKVFHLQINLTKGYDFTISEWHQEQDIFNLLNPWFHIERQYGTNIIHWICRRK